MEQLCKIEFIDLLPFNSYFIVSLETLKAHSGHNDGGGGGFFKTIKLQMMDKHLPTAKKKNWFKEN